MPESDPHRRSISDDYTEDEKVPVHEHAEAGATAVARDPRVRHTHQVPQFSIPEPQHAGVKKTLEAERALAETRPEIPANQSLRAPDSTRAPAPDNKMPGQSSSSGGLDFDTATREQTILNGLLSILAMGREDVRSYRVLLFSNLLLAFTIPLSALAVQHTEIFKRTSLGFLPHPDWCLFGLWLLGVLSLAYGIYSIMPSIKRRDEGLAVHRVNEAARYLADQRTEKAIGSILKAIEKEDERLTATNLSRRPFFLTFALFLACVTIEFALILFS